MTSRGCSSEGDFPGGGGGGGGGVSSQGYVLTPVRLPTCNNSTLWFPYLAGPLEADRANAPEVLEAPWNQ